MSFSLPLLMNYTTTLICFSVYPPPILVKHPIWRHNDADFFISVKGLVFELHRQQFLQSPYFRILLHHFETERLVSRGNTLSTPLPFDDLPETLLTAFLCLLYDEENFTATEVEWHTLKRLSIDWGFPHQTAVAIRTIAYIREQRLPRAHRRLLNNFITRRDCEELRNRWR